MRQSTSERVSKYVPLLTTFWATCHGQRPISPVREKVRLSGAQFQSQKPGRLMRVPEYAWVFENRHQFLSCETHCRSFRGFAIQCPAGGMTNVWCNDSF